MRSEDAYLLVLALTLLWGGLIAQLAHPTHRRLACVLPGAFLCGLFRLWHAPACSAALYVLLRAVPRASAPIASLAFAFGVQLALRLAPGGLSGIGNGLHLVLTLRHAALGFHLADGAPCAQSMYEHVAYSLSFYGLFTMPYLTFAQHEAAIHHGHAHRDWLGALAALCRAACYACGFIVLRERFPIAPIGTADFAARLPWLGARLLYAQLSLAQVRLRLYCAWSVAEAAGRLFGLPAELAASTDVQTIEFGSCARQRVRAWNTSVSRWLADIVYRRAPLRAAWARQLCVFAVSAWWHDAAPVQLRYYAFFLHVPFLLLASAAMRTAVYEPTLALLRARAPRGVALVARALICVHETFVFAYFNLAFVCGDMADVLAKWRALGWYGQWALAAALCAHVVGGRKRRQQ